MKRFSGKKKFLGVFIFIAVFAAAIAVVMLLWNALIPAIVGWSAITYWQAAGLMILCRLLLGGFGRFGKGGHQFFHKDRDVRGWHVLHDKMKDMSSDEKREYMRRHMREQFAQGRHPFDNNANPGRDEKSDDREV